MNHYFFPNPRHNLTDLSSSSLVHSSRREAYSSAVSFPPETEEVRKSRPDAIAVLGTLCAMETVPKEAEHNFILRMAHKESIKRAFVVEWPHLSRSRCNDYADGISRQSVSPNALVPSLSFNHASKSQSMFSVRKIGLWSFPSDRSPFKISTRAVT